MLGLLVPESNTSFYITPFITTQEHTGEPGNRTGVPEGQGRVSGKAPSKGAASRDLKDKPESAGQTASRRTQKQETIWNIQGQSGSEPGGEFGGMERVEKTNVQEPCVLQKVCIQT